jgi:hypothetical protein
MYSKKQLSVDGNFLWGVPGFISLFLPKRLWHCVALLLQLCFFWHQVHVLGSVASLLLAPGIAVATSLLLAPRFLYLVLWLWLAVRVYAPYHQVPGCLANTSPE